MRSFRSPTRLGDDARFKVPWVWEGSTGRVLVMEHVNGTSVGDDAIFRLPQADRNEVRSVPLPYPRLANSMSIVAREDRSEGDRSLPA